MRRVLVVAVTVVTVGLSAFVGGASAASENASCRGILVSAGAGDPGAVSEATHAFHAIAKDLGIPPGQFVASPAAKLHEGDFAGCLDALGF
jgi:hypothetical protein